MISHTPQNRIPSPAASRIIPMGDGAFCVRFFQTKCTAHKTANTRIDLASGANPSASVLMPHSVESIMFSAVARIMATTQGRTPERKASTPAYFIRFFSTAAISRMMKNEGSTTPSVAISAWYGIYMPASTPLAVQQKVHDGVNKVLAMPETQARLLAVGAELQPMSQADFAKYHMDEYKRFGEVIRKNNIKLD